MTAIRRTRIVCTIGPASAAPAVLRTLIQAGMDVARMNFSHGDHATHRQVAADVREAAEAAGRPIALLGDLQGPKIRTGPLESAFMRLVRGRTVILTGESRTRRAQDAHGQGEGAPQADNHIEISHPELVEALQRGDHVLLDDGRIELVVRSVEDRQAECSVVRGGLLGERKGVSVPGRPLPMPALTDVVSISTYGKFGAWASAGLAAANASRKPAGIVYCNGRISVVSSWAMICSSVVVALEPARAFPRARL